MPELELYDTDGNRLYLTQDECSAFCHTLELVLGIKEVQKKKKRKPLWSWSRVHAWRHVKEV